MRKYLAITIIGIFLLCGCASVQPVEKSNLTPGMAKAKIIQGQTTQNEILEIFGPPNIITKNKSGNEVWTYDKVSIESGASEVHGTLLVLGGAGVRSATSSRTFTLMIEFDGSNIVKDFSYRSSAF